MFKSRGKIISMEQNGIRQPLDNIVAMLMSDIVQGGSKMTGTNCDLFTHK
jgi:hypothetical protein